MKTSFIQFQLILSWLIIFSYLNGFCIDDQLNLRKVHEKWNYHNELCSCQKNKYKSIIKCIRSYRIREIPGSFRMYPKIENYQIGTSLNVTLIYTGNGPCLVPNASRSIEMIKNKATFEIGTALLKPNETICFICDVHPVKCLNNVIKSQSVELKRANLVFEPDNLVLFYGDVITCSCHSNLKTEWLLYSIIDTKTFVFNNALQNFAFNGSKLFINIGAKESINNLVKCVAYDRDGGIVESEMRNYTIIELPKRVIPNLPDNYAILGDNISCGSLTSVLTYVRTVILLSNNFQPNSAENFLPIPAYAKLGVMIYECVYKFLIKSMELIVMKKTFRSFIHVYRQFSWGGIKSFYFRNETLRFYLNVSTKHVLQIIQKENDFLLQVKYIPGGALINLNTDGGYYELHAILTVYVDRFSYVFHKKTGFNVFRYPVTAIFNNIIGYPGELITCSSNGAPSYLISTKLYIGIEPYDRDTAIFYYGTGVIPKALKIDTIVTIECCFSLQIGTVNAKGCDTYDVVLTEPLKLYLFNYKNYPGYVDYLIVLFVFLFLWYFFGLMLGATIGCHMYHFPNRIKNLDYRNSRKKYYDNSTYIMNSHMRVSFLLYNTFRKVQRYNVKMNDLVDALIFLRTATPLQRSIFKKQIKLNNRDSYTYGFGIVPEFVNWEREQQKKIPEKLSSIKSSAAEDEDKDEEKDKKSGDDLPDFRPQSIQHRPVYEARNITYFSPTFSGIGPRSVPTPKKADKQ